MKKLSLLLAGIFVFSLLFVFFSYHHSVTYCNVNTMHTATSFGFTDHGEARVSISYLGYDHTTMATIDVKIEKQGFLFFRTTVIDQSFTVREEEYQAELLYPIAENGFYYCTVTYTVSGEGDDDIIVFKDEKMYRKENHAVATTDTSASFVTENTPTETTSSETTSAEEIITTDTTTEATEETEPPESEEEKRLRLRYEEAVKKMKSYRQKGSIVLNNQLLQDSDTLAYLYGEFVALGDYNDSRDYLSGFAIFPDMLTSVSSVTYIDGEETASKTVSYYTYDNQGRLVSATGQEMLDRYNISAEHEHRFVYNTCGQIAYIDIFHQKDRFLMYRLWFEYGTYGDLIGIEVSDDRYLTYNLYGQLVMDKEDFQYSNGRNMTSYIYSYDGKNNVTKKTYTLDCRTYGHYQLKQTVTQTYQHQYDENGYLLRTVEKKTDDYYRYYKFYGEETTEKRRNEETIAYVYHNDASGRPLTVEITDVSRPDYKEILTYHYQTIYTYR